MTGLVEWKDPSVFKQFCLDRLAAGIDPEVIARQGDAESYQPSFEAPLHAGTEFKLREERGAWWQIGLSDGRNAWIPAKSGELLRD